MILIILVFGSILLIDFRELINKKLYKSAIVFGMIFIVSLTFSLLRNFNIEVKSTVIIIWEILKKLGIYY